MNEIVEHRGFLKETLSLVKDIEGKFLELGARFHKIREEQLYLSGYQTFEEFVIDAKMSLPNATKLIAVYQKFVLEYAIPAQELVKVGSWSSLYTIAPHCTSKEKTVELVEKATMLTRSDLEKELKGEKIDEKQTCFHGEYYDIRICRNCGTRWKHYGDS